MIWHKASKWFTIPKQDKVYVLVMGRLTQSAKLRAASVTVMLAFFMKSDYQIICFAYCFKPATIDCGYRLASTFVGDRKPTRRTDDYNSIGLLLPSLFRIY